MPPLHKSVPHLGHPSQKSLSHPCFQSAYSLHSVVFALMMKDVSLHFPHHHHHPHQRSDLMSLSGPSSGHFSLCVHSGALCLCVEQRGLSRGVCYSVMQRHKAQSFKQLSNRHSSEEKSHMGEQSEISFSATTKTLSFRIVPLMQPFSRNPSCADLLCE